MFKNLRTSTKLLILCGAFALSVGVPVYALVVEKRIAIDFARKELVGSRYLASIRDIYAEILAVEPTNGSESSRGAVLQALKNAETEAGAQLQTVELAGALAAALRGLWSNETTKAQVDSCYLDALAKAHALAARVGDDSNLALDPELDSYYVQHIVVRKLPTFIGRLAELQEFFETSVASGSPTMAREAWLPILVGLVRSTAGEVRDNLEAAYRGNLDGGLKPTIDDSFVAMLSSTNSYLGALNTSTAGIDARDAVAHSQFHTRTMQAAIGAWEVAQLQLDVLLQQRIDRQVGRLRLGLALIGALAALSILVAVLTHRHIVRPLEHLEAVASAVREGKDYDLRVRYNSHDEIGRVTTAFNEMLSELAIARKRETAERAELARVTQLTTMGEMAASIAHEVNQPLAGIVTSGNAGLRWLANETPDLDRVKTVLQRVVRDGLRASEVVRSVRAMFKKEVQQKAPLDMHELVQEVLALLRSELQSGPISVQLDAPKGLPWVMADRVQLQQVVLNLITNAIEAMRAVSDRLRLLRIEADVDDQDRVRVTVTDSGLGIDPSHVDRIFDPFFTTKSSGMGLGLSICRSIVEAHGGQLSASPGIPHGTTFRFVLPACSSGGR